jgi:tetratricopeptide (TPR) repeat protein
MLEEGRLRDAKELYEAICRVNAQDAEAWAMLGAISGELGQLDAAAEYLRKAIAIDPNNANTHFTLASILRLCNDFAGAVTHLELTVALQPDFAEAWTMLGGIHGLLGSFPQSESACRQAIALQPDSPEAHMNLANALLYLGRLDDAAASYAKVLSLNPGLALAWLMLAGVKLRLGSFDEAVTCCQRALALEPGSPEAHYNLGLAQRALGRFDEAVASLQNALRFRSDYLDAMLTLAGVQQAGGDYHAALESFTRAIRVNPGCADAHHGMATTLAMLGRQPEAVACYEEAIRLEPNHTDAYVGLGAALLPLRQIERARECYEQALRLHPGHVEALTLAANIDAHAGNVEQAYQRLQPLLEAGVENTNTLLTYAIISKSLKRQDEAIGMLQRSLANAQGQSASNLCNLHFNLGMLYDSMDRYDAAFAHYREGNALKPASFDPQRCKSDIDAFVALHTADFMKSLPRASVRSGRPVFIVGMPRSGTSLVEQILASHPGVYGAGELPDIIQLVSTLHTAIGSFEPYPYCLPRMNQQQVDHFARQYLDHLQSLAPDAVRVTDKMPGNFMHLGLIEMLFPDAKVIHCLRDPIDTCLSCYFQDFSRTHPYSYDLANLAVFYKGYEKVMDNWRQVLTLPMLEVRYEDLVADQENLSRRMVEFCGLEWDDSCLNFHKTKRFVSTASYDQVRRPIYNKSVGRWKNYQQHIAVLRDALRS